MATIRRVAVATADPGGYDAQYTSLANALAGESKDLVALDRQLLIECYAMTDTSLADFGGFVTDATRHITVRGAAGAEANAVWRTSGVYRIRRSALNAQGAINLNAAYTRLERIQVENTSTFGNRGAIYIADQPGMVCDGVFVKGAGTAGSGWFFAAGTNASSNIIRNCIAWNCGDTGFGGGTGLSGLTNNNTAAACGVGFTTSSTGPVNCVAFGCTTGFTGSPSAPSNNASEDATAPGLNSQTGIADPFTNSAAGDFSLVEGSALVNAGTTIATFSTDIAGTARPQGAAWDIGAFELPVGGPSPVNLGVPFDPSTGADFAPGIVPGTPAVALAVPFSAAEGVDHAPSVVVAPQALGIPFALIDGADFAPAIQEGVAAGAVAVPLSAAAGADFAPGITKGEGLAVPFAAAAGLDYRPALAVPEVLAAPFAPADGAEYSPVVRAMVVAIRVPLAGAAGADFAPGVRPGSITILIPFSPSEGLAFAPAILSSNLPPPLQVLEFETTLLERLEFDTTVATRLDFTTTI